jgi:hypothetical protein
VFDEIHAYDATTLNAIRGGQGRAGRLRHPVAVHVGDPALDAAHLFGFSEPATIIESDNPFRPFRIEPLPEPLTNGKGTKLEVGPAARGALREAAGLKLAVYVNQIERPRL